MSKDISIAERQPIHVEDLPWVPFERNDTTVAIDVEPGAYFRQLMDDPDCKALFVQVKFAPNYVAPAHWHPSNTIYVITHGIFHVQGEKTYLPGDVRWVRGGKSYGSETAGPEGCEFYLASLGPFATNVPDSEH